MADTNLTADLREATDDYYRQMGVWLRTHPFATLKGGDLTKAEMARRAIEARIGMPGGEGDFIADFYRAQEAEQAAQADKAARETRKAKAAGT